MPLLSILIGSVLTFSGGCSCAKALETDLPHGANETVEIRGPVVNKLSGIVADPSGAPVKAVVELYDLPPDRPDIAVNEVIGFRTRRVACVTGADGTFCFSNVPSGKYLLRAGTRQANGMNELYMRVTVDHSWFRGLFRRSKSLRLMLSLGT